MGTGKTYSTKYLLDSNNNSGAAGQVLSTTSTGINWVDANTVPGAGLWLANGNDIYNSNSGNVGIGTTSPTNGKLQIDNTTNQISIETGTSGDGRLHIGHFSNGTFIGTYGDDGGAADLIRFGTHSGDEKMRITSGGNVGIGTTNPSNKLTIDGVSDGINIIGASSYIRWNSGDMMIRNEGSYAMGFHTYDGSTSMVERMRINSSGNVGIGTTSPDYLLDIGAENIDNPVDYIRLNPTNGNSGGTSNTYGGGLIWAPHYNTYTKKSAGIIAVGEGNFFRTGLAFLTNNSASATGNYTERMRIDMDGNVGIGTTSPTSKLQINDGSANITKAMQSGGVDHDFLQLSYAGSWANNVGGLASINFTDNLSSSNTVGRIGVTYTGSQGKFVVTDLYSGGYGASGDVFTIQADGETYIKGNVGIGITSPTQKLHVNGSVRVKEAYYDSSNSAGTSGQVLSSTGSATSWVDGSGLPGGPYLPLAGNTTSTRITGEVYFSNLIPIYWRNSDNTANSFAMLNDANNDMFLINQTGGRHIEIINQATDGDIIFRADSGNGTETEYFRLDGATSKTIFETSTGHKDNVKATFGDGEDLQIYHDGSDSYIRDRGTGDLRIETDGANMLLSDGSHTFIAMNTGASDVVLKQGGNTKLTTKSSGISVSGDISVSGVVHNRDIPCLFNSNFEDAYGTSIKIVPFNNNTEANVSSKTYYHNLTMPYAGKLTKIVMKNVSGTLSSGFTTELFLYVNGSQQANSGEISLSNDSVTWTPTTNNTFSAGDVLSFAYQNSSATKTFGGVSFGVAIELTDYDI